jgi:outer membrane protein
MAEPTRIGYVDMKRLFDSAPQVTAAREALDQEFRPRNEALLADEDRLDSDEQRLLEAGNLDAESRFDLEREARNLRRSIDRRREDLSEELRFRTNAEKKRLKRSSRSPSARSPSPAVTR